MVKCYTRKFTIVFKMGLRKYRKKEREIEPEFRSQLVEREERKRERERRISNCTAGTYPRDRASWNISSECEMFFSSLFFLFSPFF